MTVTLVDVAGANFRPDGVGDKLNDTFMKRLGVKARYIPARLAIARSLAAQGTPPMVSDQIELGKAVKGDTLFGTGATLSTWFALITQRAGGNINTLKDFWP